MPTDPDAVAADLPEPRVERRRGPALVWLIPLVAVLVGAWLAYRTLSEQGPEITLHFIDGSGIESGKTKVRYKAVEVGEVGEVHLTPDLQRVEVRVRLKREMAGHLREGTRFWVVRPRVNVSGVSGLDTLLSGSYIAIAPGEGAARRDFQGLEDPPAVPAETPGRSFVLATAALGGLQQGTPVLFRGLPAGEVTGYTLAADGRSVAVNVFLRAPFERLVHADSRFWRLSAIDFSVGAQGVDLRLGSIAELVAGGIAFDNPATDVSGEAATADTRFTLYERYSEIGESDVVRRLPLLVRFSDSVHGLTVGAPVEFRGIKVGSVREVHLELDAATGSVRLPVVIELAPPRMAMMLSGSGEHEPEPYSMLARLVERGLRARLRSGSLLTGALFVDLDFVPDAPPATLLTAGRYPELPALPSLGSQLESTVTDLAAKLRRLPLEELVGELTGAAHGANRLANAPELVATLRSFDATLKGMDRLAGQVDRQLALLAPGLNRTLGAAQTALRQLDPDTPLAADLASTLEELAATARSLRELADYLTRHPEALLTGKGGKEPAR